MGFQLLLLLSKHVYFLPQQSSGNNEGRLLPWLDVSASGFPPPPCGVLENPLLILW